MAVTTDQDPKTEPADILAAEQKKEEKNKARKAKKADAEQKKKKAEEAQLKDHHNRQLLARAKMVSTSSSVNASRKSEVKGRQPSLQSHQAPKSLVEAAVTPFPIAMMASTQILTMVPFAERVPIPVLKMASVRKGNNNADAEIVPATAIVTATLPVVEEINNIINTVPETNQFADVMNIKEELAVVSEAKSNDDEISEARGNEVIREEEQEELNAETIVVPGSTTTTNVITSVPVQEGNNISNVPEANQFADLMNTKEGLVVSEDQAKNSNDVAEDKLEVRRKKLPEANQNASNAEATKKTENKVQRQKAEAIRIEGYNMFSLLLEESENEQEQDIEAKRVEEAATTTEENPCGSESEKEPEIEAKRVEESAITTEEKPHESWFEAESSREEQNMEAKRVEEDAAAKKKTEKRKRKRKRKAEKRNESFPSIGVLSLALVCLLIYSFL
ncbi:hypothetical protein RchiOBHm_Chr4g0443051 [Rosa chinensis]|uniref:Uncharacterized protein n=1 Tax=Rosa chinensis TaxID=74649 RepID=A0A2P6R3Q8_ROSCH|nr:uncharacterized protein LOC121052684 [Rosa chinensis]PRQ41077.1 hypothetical protein RchiOBHm_Chr4g0443051 [Rosa chinensis]